MKAPLYNLEGKTVGEVDLKDDMFNRPWNGALVRQALLALAANRRESLAHTKTRAEVSGGGKKPWKQKHTGRARHGSIRSPIWKGGGVTHGPRKDKQYGQKINKKMRRIATNMALSQKYKDGEVRFIETFSQESKKTKELAKALAAFPSTLIIAGKASAAIARVARNIKKVHAIPSPSMNIEDVLKYKNVFIEKAALEEMQGVK